MRNNGPAAVDETVLVPAWAAAAAVPAWRRVPALLAALDRADADRVDRLPLGAVAAEVLRLVRQWSGPTLQATVGCTSCGVQLQTEVSLDAFLAMDDPDRQDSSTISVTGRRLRLRALRPADLAAAATAADEADAEDVLLRRCLLDVDPPLPDIGGAELLDDPEIRAAASDALAALDPLGVVTLSVSCPECATPDEPVADLIGWGWALVDTRVRRLIGEVHRLASAYGWSEPQVLALGPERRRAYLELVP